MIRQLLPGLKLFSTPDGHPYATCKLKSGILTFAIGSKRFEQLIQREYYQQHNSTIKPDDLKAAMQAAKGEALFGGNIHDVFVRIAYHDEKLFLDLGDPSGRVAVVNKQGWDILDQSPVPFVRGSNQKALPLPQRFKGDANSIELLRPLINVGSEDDWILVVAWLIGTLLPEGGYPILVLQGEQDSGKSATAKVLRSVIDPATEGVRRLPGGAHNLMIAAQHNHILPFDNLSGLTNTMSDVLCTLSTGVGFATRELYTDADEYIVKARRPLILNGIDEIARRPDLLSRSIIIHLPRLKRRKTESEMTVELEKVLPRVLGGILGAASIGLSRMDSIDTTNLPRMADYSRFVIACEPGLPWPKGAFIKAYRRNRLLAEAQQLELDPLAGVLIQFIGGRPRKNGIIYRSSPTDLLKKLQLLDTHPDPRKQAVPATANWLMNKLKRLNPMLRSIHGIEVVQIDSLRSKNARVVVIREIRTIAKTQSPTNSKTKVGMSATSTTI